MNLWATIIKFTTGKTDADFKAGVSEEKFDDRYKSYISKFDRSLNQKFDSAADEKMVSQRKTFGVTQDMVNAYYDIATDFYEYGWGQSFHFAPRYPGEAFDAAIARHEHFLAARLGLKEGMKVLDVGCGIGGPLRNIARFSGAHVTGLNNNEYQVNRATTLNRRAKLTHLTQMAKGDFMRMPFQDASFDAVYAIEATCHAQDRTGCFKEVNRVLKEGGYFGVYEWVMTDAYDPNNEEHRRIKHGIEIGNGLPELTDWKEVKSHLVAAGFEVIDCFDVVDFANRTSSEITWYEPFTPSYNIRQIKLTPIGRRFTQFVSITKPNMNSHHRVCRWLTFLKSSNSHLQAPVKHTVFCLRLPKLCSRAARLESLHQCSFIYARKSPRNERLPLC